ncbi:MAG: LacI family transcriptional regulator [Petroclostridium sp.]|uniref:substrate-binding domain-containing protein n=1 Tax=Petroclostridium xylanilyticum TaxID=1792311 RepID=UPI0018E3CEBC|nr:substrate-binding domain-containing protein [Petroclostridium xylanilyticum]MBZ4645950.1 transcriptional regulator [Clostridia bacterium]MDK2811171.1 LacI family transcriptional regulator [Petroclostridium sp.]
MKNGVTMQDIADKLNVSCVTVSKALNDKEGVSEELKKKIKKLAEEMGYRYNTLAKSIKEGYSYNIGIIVAERFTDMKEISQSFYMKFYQHISKMLEEHQYAGILHILMQEDEEQLNLPRIYHERKVDGFIILGQVSKKYIELLQNIEIPIIFLDFYDEHMDIDSIVTDNFYGAYQITNYLIHNGHKKIAYVGNIYATSSIQDRFLGYYKALLEHRMELNNNYLINDRDERGKYIPFALPEDDMPTAFVCNCDQVAYNLIHKLNELDYDVPDDISVVGFDNDIFASISRPRLTTVEIDMQEMARLAVECIVKKVRNDALKYGRILIKGKIIYRDSVKKIKQGS